MAGGILLKNLLETVGLIILSMGGAGAIIMSVSSFLANKIATRLEQKYKLRIDKELEAYKAGLTQRSYVTKVQFDIEFEVYRKLSKGMFEFISTLYTTIEEKHYPKKEGENHREKVAEEIRTYTEMVDKAATLQELLYPKARPIMAGSGLVLRKVLSWKPVHRQSVTAPAGTETLFDGDPLGCLLRRSAFDHNAFLRLPRPVDQPVRQRRRIAAAPIFREQHPADLHASLVICVIDHIADKSPVFLGGIHKRRLRQSCMMQKCLGLRPVERRFQIPHDLRVRQQLVQRVCVTGLHPANCDIHWFSSDL